MKRLVSAEGPEWLGRLIHSATRVNRRLYSLKW